MAVTRQRTEPLRGSDGRVFDLAEASVAKKKSRLPEIALGVLLVAGCALAALAWQTIADPSRSVLAVNGDIARGEVITVDDLQAVRVASDDVINVIGAEQSSLVVGRIAQVDLAPGTLLAPGMTAEVAAIEPGQALVGVTVPAGDLPSSALRVGSLVDLVVTAANTNDDSFLNQVDGAILVDDAAVAEISGDGERVTLSLAVADTDAALVARAVAADRIRLVAVSDEPSADGESSDTDSSNGGGP